MRVNIITLLSLIAFLSISCGGGKSKTFTLNNIEFVYEGPLYEGPNPSQVVVAVDLKTIFQDEFKEGMSVDHATLKKAEISPGDSTGFEGISALVLSLAGDNEDLKMQELAVINPIQAKAQSAVLSPSAEADATGFFNEKQFYLVLDATLAKDLESNIKMKGNFEFELKY